MSHPVFVYGYLACSDPRTGQRHVIMDPGYPGMVAGYPESIDLVFDNWRGEAERTSFRAGAGVIQVSVPNAGWVQMYIYRLIHDDSVSGLQQVDEPNANVGGGWHPARFGVVYNPNQYEYRETIVGMYRFADPDGTLGGPEAVTIYEGSRRVSGLRYVAQSPDIWSDLPSLDGIVTGVVSGG